MYDREFLETYIGDIDVLAINLSNCFNSIEKYVSQTEYRFIVSHPFNKTPEEIVIKIMNENIPHLIGLSKNHHLNLPTTQPKIIFQKVKNNDENWSLEELILADEGWFAACREKLVGIFFIYQIMQNIETTNYATSPFRSPKNNKFYKRIVERDKVSYIFIKNIEGAIYSFEFTENPSEHNVFIPRSLKINDPVEEYLTPISLENIKTERIKINKR